MIPSSSRKKLLIVEANNDSKLLIKDLIENSFSNELQIYTCGNIKDAVNCLNVDAIDFVISGYSFLDGDGGEIYDCIRKSKKMTKLAFYTGNLTQEIANPENFFSGFFYKPNIRSLIPLIRDSWLNDYS